jgi:hypothetical protein
MRLQTPKYDLTTIINEEGEEETTVGAYVFYRPNKGRQIYRQYFPPQGYEGDHKRLVNLDYNSFY